MKSLQCIKPGCTNVVTEEDSYCEACEALKMSIAAQIDAKFNTVGQEPSSLLQDYDRARAGKAFPSAGALGFEGFK